MNLLTITQVSKPRSCHASVNHSGWNGRGGDGLARPAGILRTDVMMYKETSGFDI